VKYIHKPGRAEVKGRGPHHGLALPLFNTPALRIEVKAQAQTLLNRSERV
jgi:hypothetical protein